MENLRFLDEIPGGFLICYAAGIQEIIYANRVALQICGCDTQKELLEFTQGSFRGLVCPEDLEAWEDSVHRQLAVGRYDLDGTAYRIRQKDGSLCWVEEYGHFYHDEFIGDIFYLFWSDSSGERKRQRILQNRILTDALEKADMAIKAKKAFLSHISHELYTPLNAILGSTTLAKSSFGDPDALSEYLEQIEVASYHLLEMVSKALEVASSQSTAGSMQTECVLPEIMQTIYDFLLPQAQEKSIEFSLDCKNIEHRVIYVDPEQLRQMILNLANNAITYTNPGGKVDIVLTEGEPLSDNQVFYHLEVRDTGIGIQEEFLERIFEPFARERSSTLSGVQGIGLGLTVVKNIIDLLGGTITVDTKVNEGSTFAVSLPLRILSLPDAHGKQNTGSPKLRILLAEDDALNREVETKLLQRKGFEVDTVSNGADVLVRMGQTLPGTYDLLILDLQMPVMDGWETAAAIRKLPDSAVAQIPIIALSAHVGFQERQKSLERGIDAHLPKPMDLNKLLETIEKLTMGQTREI